MVNYGLKDRVALITGANNPQGIGATTAFAFAREGAKVILVYKKLPRPFDKTKTDKNGTDKYFQANAGNADNVESRLKEMNADHLIIESDITKEDSVNEIYSAALERYGRVDILVNNAADGDMDGFDTIIFMRIYAKTKEDIVPSRILCQWPVCTSSDIEGGFKKESHRTNS